MNSSGHRFCSVSSLKYICCHLFKIKDGSTQASERHFCRGQYIGVLLCWNSIPLVVGSAVFPACSLSATICLKLKMDQRTPPSAIFVVVKSSVSCCVGNQIHVILTPVKGKKHGGIIVRWTAPGKKKRFNDSPFPPSHHLIPVNLPQAVSFISSSQDHILRNPIRQLFQSRLMVLKQKYVQSFVELFKNLWTHTDVHASY